MNLISKKLCLVIFAITPLTSCSIAGYVADSAKVYWDENKDALKEFAVEQAEKLKDEAIATAISYTDEKLAEKHKQAVEDLIVSGVTLSEMDTDGDGVVSEDELAAYAKSNPVGFATGAGMGGVAFYAMWLARQRFGRKEDGPVVVAG